MKPFGKERLIFEEIIVALSLKTMTNIEGEIVS